MKSMRTKLILMFMLTLFVSAITIGGYSITQVKSKTIQAAQEKLKSDSSLGLALINSKYPGNWSIKEGKMYKGNTLLNNNFGIIDQIGKMTHGTVTIFQNDTRITTNVKSATGTRAVGTTVSNTVKQAVLKEGKEYIGKADVVGTMNQTDYKPIKDAQGKIIGIWYVGVPNTVYNNIANKVATHIVWLMIVEIILGIIVFWFVATYWLRPIKDITNVTNEIAQGNLKTEAVLTKNRDEVGRLIKSVNQMSTNLRDLIRNVSESSLEVKSVEGLINKKTTQSIDSSSDVAHSLERLTALADEQKLVMQETLKATGENAQGVQIVAETAQDVTIHSNHTLDNAISGKQSIEKVIDQMKTIDETVKNTIEKIDRLNTRSQDINKLLELIKDIADQTNLLSLNAAIEASRAGEHGRGFAVVAQEVKKLAEQTAESINEVNALVNQIQEYSTQSVHSMNQVKKEVSEGVMVVHNSEKAFNEIVHSTKDTHGKIEEMSAASQQMAASSQEMAASVEQITDIIGNTKDEIKSISNKSNEQLESMNEIGGLLINLVNVSTTLRQVVSKFEV